MRPTLTTMAASSSAVAGTLFEVRYYERFFTTSPSIFKLGSQVQKENAEGVIARNVPVEVQTFRGSARAAPASIPNQPAPEISLAAEQAARRSPVALVPICTV
jgi:hypothetical protein